MSEENTLPLDQPMQRLRDGERPVRFVLAGAFNTIFGLALFPAMLWLSPYLHQHYMVGLILSQAVCTICAFFIYKLGVFRTQANIVREFWVFSSFYYATYALNLVALPALVVGAEIPPIPAQLGFSFATMVGSYFWHSLVTFRTTDRHDDHGRIPPA